MKKWVCVAGFLGLVASLVFAGGGTERNKIVIYTSMYEDAIKSVQADLKKDFPRYNIEFVYGGSVRLQHRLDIERAAGKLGCDILMTAEPSYSLALKQANMLHSFKSSEADNLAFEYDPDGYWYPVRINNMIMAYNPEKYDKSVLPHSFYEFANDTRVRNAITMRNPNVSGTSRAALAALKDKYGYNYFDSLARQGIQIFYGNEGITKLESGEFRVIMVLEETILKMRQETNSKLEVIYPADGTIMIPSPIMIINDNWSANKNAKIAEKITDWFLSEKGQNAIVGSWMHSVRKNFPRIPYDSISTDEIRTNSIPIQWENNFKQREEMLTRFEESLANRK